LWLQLAFLSCLVEARQSPQEVDEESFSGVSMWCQRWSEQHAAKIEATICFVRVACVAVLVLIVADLVWFGIVHQGIRSAVFGLVRAESLARLERSLDEESLLLVESSYSAPNASGVRRFVGNPAQLASWSRLSLTLADASSDDGAPSLESGIRTVREEYVGIGVDLHVLQTTYVIRSVRDIVSWLAIFAASRLILQRLGSVLES